MMPVILEFLAFEAVRLIPSASCLGTSVRISGHLGSVDFRGRAVKVCLVSSAPLEPSGKCSTVECTSPFFLHFVAANC